MADNFKSDLEMDRQELMEQGFDPDYNDRDDSLTGEPTSRTDLAKSLGKTGFAGLSLIARQLGFDFYPTKDTERAIEKRLGFAEGGDTYGMAAQMEQLDFVQPSIAKPPLEKPKAISRRPGFRGDGPLDFKGFGSYLKENVSKEEFMEGLDNAAEWLVPFHDAGSNMYNVFEEYSKPEDQRDYGYIKEELGKAGNSAATEAAVWLLGGVVTKYGLKGLKALNELRKRIMSSKTAKIGSAAMLASEAAVPSQKEEDQKPELIGFAMGGVVSKLVNKYGDDVVDFLGDTFEEVMTPVKVTSKGTQKTGEAILRPSAEVAENLDPRMGRAMAADTAGSIMPGPGKFFDPSKKGYKGDRFTGMLRDSDIDLDLEFGNYIMMGKGAPKDVSNETFENLFVSARPSEKRTSTSKAFNIKEQRKIKTGEENPNVQNKAVARANLYDGPSLTVADMKANYKAATGKTGSEVRTNLLQPERFKIVTDEGDRLLDHPIVAVETKGKGGKHFYTLDTQFVGPVRMDRLTQKAKRKNPRTGEVREEVPQPNLRPATVGDVKVGEQIGTIRVGKKEHPLYNYIEVDATAAAPEGMGSIPKFNEGGMAMKEQMGYALGGDVEIDAESGNAVPPGSRPEEVRDDIPAMLSEGEYVVPADVTRYYGVKFFEDLRDQAKADLAEMDANGRIGGEPVPETEDDLTEDEMSLLGEVMAMNQGGMVPQMNQQQQMNPIPSVDPQMQQPMQQQPQQPVSYNQPSGMAVGGMVGQNPNVDAFGNPIGPSIPTTPQNPTSLQPIDPSASSIYGLDKAATDTPTTSVQVDSPISTTPATPTGDESGMKSVFYIHKDGRRISVLILNGRPISTTPADFNEFVEDTPENRTKLNFSEGGSGGGAGGGTGDTGPATVGATEDTGGDDTSTDVYKTSATGKGVTRDTNTPEGAYEAYKDSGVDVNGTVEAAKKALDETTKLPKVAGIVAGAVNPFLGLAVGGGNVVNQLQGVSKAHANKRMAEFLGKTEDANAIQADIDRFLQNAPGAVSALDSVVATGEQRFQDALAAATSINAPDEAVLYTDNLTDVGKANLQEYLQTFKSDVSAIRPMLRPEGFTPSVAQVQDKLNKGLELSAEERSILEGAGATKKVSAVAARPKGKYDPTSNPQLSGGFKTNTLSAAEQNSFDAAVDSGNSAVANHFASINRLRNKQDAYAESGFDPAVGASMGLSTYDMEQAEEYGGSVQTAINEGRAEKESGVLNFLKPVKVTDYSKSKNKSTGTTKSTTRQTSTERVATSRSTADIQKEINQKIKNATDSSGNVDWNKANVGSLVKEREASKSQPAAKPAAKPASKPSGASGSPKAASKPKKSGGGCFLTTAIVDRRGEADNGPTLTKLRDFRDTYMAAIPADVEEYYRVAPQIVASIPADHKDWDWIGSQVDKSVEFIDNNLLDDAYKTYKAMVKKLERDWL